MIGFNVVKSRLRILGIFDIRSPESLVHRIINIWYRAFVLILLILLMVSSSWFMMFEAKTFGDFASVVPIIAGGCIGLASHVSFLLDTSNIIQLINDLNRLVQSSEWKLLILADQRDLYQVNLFPRSWKPFNLWRGKQKIWKAINNSCILTVIRLYTHIFVTECDYIILSILYKRNKQWNVSSPLTINVSIPQNSFDNSIRKLKLYSIQFAVWLASNIAIFSNIHLPVTFAILLLHCVFRYNISSNRFVLAFDCFHFGFGIEFI